MASAARGESSNPYGGGLGTGGKFRKPTARRSQKTPYDRPPTSVRNSGRVGGEDQGGGWLSKLVDPAQRLITYSAHRLFETVFRKRLVSGETPLQSPEQQKQLPERDVIQEAKVGHTENTSDLARKNDLIQIEDTNAIVDSTKDGFTDFEKLLKEKTFTRSEVDRLTTLLRSKAGVSSTVNGEPRNEVSIVRHPPSHEMDRVHPDNGSMNALVSTPLGSSSALDECIASPAQLAKAYMGSRPSDVTPSMLDMRGQVVREDSVFLNRTPYPSKSPTVSLVSKPYGQRLQENGFVTPRPRGRSAVYNMARTPYSRPQSIVKMGSLFQASPSTREETLSSGSRQGFQSGLKRRSSVLDNDIGSVGPVRRIRQKSNLSSRSLALPASESPLSIRASGGLLSTHTSKNTAEDIPGSSFDLVPSKSSEMASKILQQLDKMVSTREKSPSKLSPSMLHGRALKSLQNVEAPKFLDNILEKKATIPSSSYQKQGKSIESSSKEVLAPSEKTGGTVEGTSKTVSANDQEIRGKGTYLPLKSSLEEHPPKKRAFRMSAHEELFELDDDHGTGSIQFEVTEKQNAFKVESGAINMPKERKLTFSEAMPSTSYISNGDASQGISNGSLETGKSKSTAMPVEAVQRSSVASEPTSKFIQGTEKSNAFPGKLTSDEKLIPREEPEKAAAVFPNIFSSPATTVLSNQNTGVSADIKLEKTSSPAGVSETSAKPTEAKKTVSNSAFGAESTSSAASTLNGSIFSAGANTVSPPTNNGSLGSGASFPSSFSTTPSNNSGNKISSTVQSLAATSAASSVFEKLPTNTGNDSNSGSNSQSTSAPPLSSTSPFKFGEPTSLFSVSSGHISKATEVKNPAFGNINSFKFGGVPSADTSTGNILSANSSEIKSMPGFVVGSSSPAVADAGNNIFGGTSSGVGGSTLNGASSAPGSSGSLIFGVTSSSTPGTETNIISGSTIASTGSSIFGTSSPAFASSGNSMFGGVAASTGSGVFGFNAVSSASAASSQSQASTLFGTANAQTDNTGSGTTTSTQSVPFKFGSSAPAPSFGLSESTSLASNSSPFGLTKSEPAVFASGSTPQLSSTNSSSSSSGTTSSSLFGTNWQAPNSAPVFSSSFTTGSSASAPTFLFGGSSAAAGSSAYAPMFTASINTPSSSPIFGFNSTAPATQQPVFGNSAPSATLSPSPFGNSTPGFSFGATTPPPNTNGVKNNQQMSMEDSMAEDTDQANKPSMVQPMFGQPSVSMPQPGFTFGGAPATPPPSMANPFQFGGQPTASSPFGGQPTASTPFGGQPTASTPFGGQPTASTPFGGQPTASTPFGGQPTASTPFGGQPTASTPFGGQPIASTPQNASPFQASQSLEFQGGGSFSLGSTGGGDKTGRRIFKAKKNNRKK